MTPTERAKTAMAAALKDCGGIYSPEVDQFARSNLAHEALRALLADPGLLFDLAVEAGALEQVGWFTPGMPDGPSVGGLIDGQFNDDDQPIYRRVEGGE